MEGDGGEAVFLNGDFAEGDGGWDVVCIDGGVCVLHHLLEECEGDVAGLLGGVGTCVGGAVVAHGVEVSLCCGAYLAIIVAASSEEEEEAGDEYFFHEWMGIEGKTK